MIENIFNKLGGFKAIFPKIGFLVIISGLLFFIVSKIRNSNRRKRMDVGLKGSLKYDFGRKILERSIDLDGSDKMVFSIGPEALSDNHMKVEEGTSFKFSVSPVKSQDDIRIINIKCHPPGVLKFRGEVMSEVNLYNGWEITMSDISVRYESNDMLFHGKNHLKGRL